MDVLSDLKDQAAAELVHAAEDLPIQLTVRDVAHFLGIGRSTAYKLVRSEGFPAVRFPGCKRLVIPKKLFLDWYVSHFLQKSTITSQGQDEASSVNTESTPAIDLVHPPEKML